jgi:hypothetical protein
MSHANDYLNTVQQFGACLASMLATTNTARPLATKAKDDIACTDTTVISSSAGVSTVTDTVQQYLAKCTDKGLDHLETYLSQFFSRPWHGLEHNPMITLLYSNPIAVRQILSYINRQTKRVQKALLSTSGTGDSLTPTRTQLTDFDSGDIPLVYMFDYPHPSVAFLFGSLPQVYSEHQPWTMSGGAFEIRANVPTTPTNEISCMSNNDMHKPMSNQDSSHGLRITFRQSDQARVKEMLASWQTSVSSVKYVWSEHTFELCAWTRSQAQCTSSIVRRMIQSLDTFRKLRRDVRAMLCSPIARSLCVILHGEPGTGKSSIANELACKFDMSLYEMCMPLLPKMVPPGMSPSDFADSGDAHMDRQLRMAAKTGCASVLLFDDVLTDGNGNVQCCVSRAKMLSICEGRDLPLKSVIIFTSNSTHAQLNGLYDGALCRPGRARLLAVDPLNVNEKARMQRLLPQAHRHLLDKNSKLCDIVEAIVDAP